MSDGFLEFGLSVFTWREHDDDTAFVLLLFPKIENEADEGILVVLVRYKSSRSLLPSLIGNQVQIGLQRRPPKSVMSHSYMGDAEESTPGVLSPNTMFPSIEALRCVKTPLFGEHKAYLKIIIHK